MDIFRSPNVDLVASAEFLPFRESVFTQVYSKCLFEHLPNRSIFTHEVSRVLGFGGKAVIITDNAAYLPLYLISTKKSSQSRLQAPISGP